LGGIAVIDDVIVDEVREIRDQYAKQFDYDLDAICRDLQEKQSRSERQLVSFPSKQPRKKGIVPFEKKTMFEENRHV
jgi:hypothetical protein